MGGLETAPGGISVDSAADRRRFQRHSEGERPSKRRRRTGPGLLSISGGTRFTEPGGNGPIGPAIYVEWAVLSVEA